MNELDVNEDDIQFYEALGLQQFISNKKSSLYAENTFNFAALHTMLTSIIRNLGKIAVFFNTRGNILEQLCAEFDDQDESDFHSQPNNHTTN